jgi:hypothetical protein
VPERSVRPLPIPAIAPAVTQETISAEPAAPQPPTAATLPISFEVVTEPATVQRVRFEKTTSYRWEQRGIVAIDQAAANHEYVLTLADPTETILASATTGTDGAATIDFVLPIGAAPGTRRLIVRDGSSGRNVAATMIAVVAPAECVTNDPSSDSDGDRVTDDCDRSDLDGPAADLDADDIANAHDNCPHDPNPGQERQGERSTGLVCDTDEGNNPLDALRDAAG